MQIEILGSESLGVRGLSCVVRVGDRTIVIDPGLALGYQRHGLLPHPAQVAVGERVRRRILAALREATDVVMSHFHGDHIPLPDANPYQLDADRVKSLCRDLRFWTKGPDGLSRNMLERRDALAKILQRELPNTEGQSDGPLAFSPAVPHGERRSRLGKVMMTRITGDRSVFVHGSDIQLLDAQAVEWILSWHPDILLVSGPPIYHRWFSSKQGEVVWRHAERLAQAVGTLILDHHLLRCEEGARWLSRLSSRAGRKVLCAADFMGCPRRLLEAHRTRLYKRMPVPDGWHEAYARGEVDTRPYREGTSR